MQTSVPTVSRVYIIHSVVIPGRKATFVEADLQTRSSLLGAGTVVFEPDQTRLDQLGFHAPEALLVNSNSGVMIPVHTSSQVILADWYRCRIASQISVHHPPRVV